MYIRKVETWKNCVKIPVVLKIMHKCKMKTNNFKVIYSNVVCYRQYIDTVFQNNFSIYHTSNIQRMGHRYGLSNWQQQLNLFFSRVSGKMESATCEKKGFNNKKVSRRESWSKEPAAILVKSWTGWFLHSKNLPYKNFLLIILIMLQPLVF